MLRLIYNWRMWQLLQDLHSTQRVWSSTCSPQDHFSTSVLPYIRYQREQWLFDQRPVGCLRGICLSGLGPSKISLFRLLSHLALWKQDWEHSEQFKSRLGFGECSELVSLLHVCLCTTGANSLKKINMYVKKVWKTSDKWGSFFQFVPAKPTVLWLIIEAEFRSAECSQIRSYLHLSTNGQPGIFFLLSC